MVLDRSGWLRVKRRTNSSLLMSAEQILDPRSLPTALPFALGQPDRSLPPLFVLGRGASRRPAADEGAGAGSGRGRDQTLVLALDGRVGDLEDIEDAHGDVVGQLGSVPDIPIKRTLPSSRKASMVSIVPSASSRSRLGEMCTCSRSRRSVPSRRRLCSIPALMFSGRKSWGNGGVAPGGRVVEEASALGGQEVLVAAVTDVAADQLFAAAVVDGGVDQVDAPVEHGVEEDASLVIVDRRPRGWPRSSMAPYPRMATSVPVCPSGRVSMLMDARYPSRIHMRADGRAGRFPAATERRRFGR